MSQTDANWRAPAHALATLRPASVCTGASHGLRPHSGAREPWPGRVRLRESDGPDQPGAPVKSDEGAKGRVFLT